MKRELVLPDWVKKLPDDACLKSKEVMVLLGLKSGCATSAVARGLLPPPTRCALGVYRYHLQWTVASLKKHVQQQQQNDSTKEEV